MIYRQSTVLAKYSSFDGIPAQVLAEATRRGTMVHRAIAARLLTLYSPPLPEECRGYLASFEKFEPTIKVIHGVEKQFVDEGLGVIGTIDLLAEIEGKTGISVIDWKSPMTKTSVWACQCAIYKYLSKADNCGTLRLDSEGGTPKMDWWEGDIQSLPAFISALNAHKYLIEDGKQNG